MKLINPNSKRGIVNIFADFILKYINPKLNTIIQVTDLNHFFLINGITESNDLLDIQKIKIDFINEYGYLFNNPTNTINTMDLIQYGKSPTKNEFRDLWVRFYDSPRSIYHRALNLQETPKNAMSVDYDNGLVYEVNYDSESGPFMTKYSEIQISSEFPHGYSLSMGRTLFYYSEYIANQVMPSTFTTQMDFYISNKIDENDEQLIDIRSYTSLNTAQDIRSLILDNFSFNFKELENKLIGYDFCDDIKKPTEVKPWLVKDINPNDLIIA
jgi:hypothetical protein